MIKTIIVDRVLKDKIVVNQPHEHLLGFIFEYEPADVFGGKLPNYQVVSYELYKHLSIGDTVTTRMIVLPG